MKRTFLFLGLLIVLMAACGPVDLNATMPTFEASTLKPG